MINTAHLALYAKRLLIVLALSTLAVFLISELGILLQNENAARAPETVELIIPAGTAAAVAAGEEAPGIPDEISFVLGDTLLVRNQDEVDHSLGPLYIPAGASARLTLEEPENFALTCSFKASRYLGLDVRPPTTWQTRLTALAFGVPPTAALFFVYSLAVYPIAAPDDKSAAPSQAA
jgi:hypothetical protein